MRRFVFERLNTGGKKLSAQEIRNAVYGGEFNNLIVRVSRNDVFTRIWGIPPYTNADPNEYYEEQARQKNALYKVMGDCQLVLRFFALDRDAHIQGSMKSMLDRCMERNLSCTFEAAEMLGRRYIERLTFADELFDGRPFTLSGNPKRTDRPVAGVYDGVMIAIDGLWDFREKIMANKARAQRAYGDLVEREAATGTLTGSANTASDIKSRIALFKNLFSELV